MILTTLLHLDDGREWRGGQQQAALLAEGLAARSIPQIAVCTAGSPLSERLKGKGIEVAEMEFRGEWDLCAARRLARICEERDVGIVHAHTAHAHAIALRARRAILKRSANAPKIVTTRRVDFAVGGSWFSRRKYRAPDQHFIAISNRVREILIEGGVDPARIDLVHSGVIPQSDASMPSRREVRDRFSIPSDGFAIVNFGALTHHKGHRWLIEAAESLVKKHSAIQIHIFGEGELRGTLEDQIKRLELKNAVKLHGFVPEVRRHLRGFDLYVSSSHLEGLGTSIIDAMLAGVPVVAAAGGGVVDLIEDGKSGVLCEARSGLKLASALERALSLDEEEKRLFIESARRKALKRFTAEAMIEGNLAVYCKLTA